MSVSTVSPLLASTPEQGFLPGKSGRSGPAGGRETGYTTWPSRLERLPGNERSERITEPRRGRNTFEQAVAASPALKRARGALKDVEKRFPYRFSTRKAKMRFPLCFIIQSHAAIEKCRYIPVPAASYRKTWFFNSLLMTACHAGFRRELPRAPLRMSTALRRTGAWTRTNRWITWTQRG